MRRPATAAHRLERVSAQFAVVMLEIGQHDHRVDAGIALDELEAKSRRHSDAEGAIDRAARLREQFRPEMRIRGRARQHKLQTSLDDKREELAAVQAKLRSERARLARLRARLLVVRRTLAQRLVELYKADRPDIVTVVLNSNGFEDLLERTEFMHRISQQDAHIMDVVRIAKADATSTEARLDTLEKTEARVAAQIQQQRAQAFFH